MLVKLKNESKHYRPPQVYYSVAAISEHHCLTSSFTSTQVVFQFITTFVMRVVFVFLTIVILVLQLAKPTLAGRRGSRRKEGGEKELVDKWRERKEEERKKNGTEQESGANIGESEVNTSREETLPSSADIAEEVSVEVEEEVGREAGRRGSRRKEGGEKELGDKWRERKEEERKKNGTEQESGANIGEIEVNTDSEETLPSSVDIAEEVPVEEEEAEREAGIEGGREVGGDCSLVSASIKDKLRCELDKNSTSDIKEKLKDKLKDRLKDKVDNKKVIVTEKNKKCGANTSKKKRNKKKKPEEEKEEDVKEYYHQCSYLNSRSLPQTCYLSPDLVCDGISACSDDECGCHGDVFYCSDGNGCVVMEQVCDGHADCLDQSDECVCESYLRCETDRVFPMCKRAEERAGKCAGAQLATTTTLTENSQSLLQCFNQFRRSSLKWNKKNVDNIRDNPLFDTKTARKTLRTACKAECQPIDNHCDQVNWNQVRVDLKSRSLSINYTCGDGTTLPLSPDRDVCDGYNDCPDSSDETFCLSRFYCTDGTGNLPRSKVCDSVPDCADLSDECQSCARANLADEKYLISNKYLSYYMVVLCLVVLALNCRGLYRHGVRLHNITRHSTRVDSVLCLQLSLYDSLMGIYLLILIQKHFQLYGSYCLQDPAWRSSSVCNFSGFIFTFSSHGSLLTVLIMGAIRCYNCENVLSYISLKRLLLGLLLGNVLNMLCSVVVLLPTQYLENIFVTSLFFQDNRLLKKGTKTLIDEILQEYYGTNTSLQLHSWSSRLTLLSQITSNSDLFVPKYKFGFFNQSPLCIQNLFSNNPDESLQLLKLLYICFLGVVILSFSVCYICIVQVRYKSAVPSASPGNRRAALKNNKKLSRKVSLIISSQLLAWIPIIIATILSLADREIPPDFYEMAAIVLIPVNSLLNPLFHSPRHVAGRKERGGTRSTVVTQLGTVRSVGSRQQIFQRVCRTPGEMEGREGQERREEKTEEELEKKSSGLECVSNSLVGIELK